MKRLVSFLAYGAAVLTILLAVALPIKVLPIFLSVVAALDLKIAPLYSGGKVDFVIDRGTHQIEVYHPVFPALIGEGSKGFVQLVWKPRSALPSEVKDEIDLNRDGAIDLEILFTNPPGDSPAPVMTVHPRSSWVKRVAQSPTLSLETVLIEKVGDSTFIRIPLQKIPSR